MKDTALSGNFTAIDTETTGLSWSRCEVIEIGAVRFRNWKATDTYSVLIKPHGTLPRQITALTGITPEMLKGCPYFEEVSDEFMNFLGDDRIVGHNLSFDLNFLSVCGAPMYTSGFEFTDTLEISRNMFIKGQDIENHTLSAMCSHYGIEIRHAHRASDDALATGLLYEKLVKDAGYSG